MSDWLRRLKLPPPDNDDPLPCEKIDEDDDQQTELQDFENENT